MTNGAEAGSSGAPARKASSEMPLPFCGDEYPPLKGSPGAVICTKACHPETQVHMNEEDLDATWTVMEWITFFAVGSTQPPSSD